jgi:hypothetical protein
MPVWGHDWGVGVNVKVRVVRKGVTLANEGTSSLLEQNIIIYTVHM